MFRTTSSALLAFTLCFVSSLLASPATAESPAELFPFSLPGDDLTEGITDLSFLNARPANDPVTVRDGHFYAGGKPIRFWGVCVIGAACFPSHDEAPRLARRLASRGLNQVRIHLIDGYCAPTGLFDPAYKGQLRILPRSSTSSISSLPNSRSAGSTWSCRSTADHWRNITGAGDYPGFDPQRFASFSSGIPLWNENFLKTEQQFARDFFGHVNPYTGKAYTEEPAVACLEIINENGILCAWRGGHFRKAWPASMIADLQRHWNRFLASRYSTTDRLRQAWAQGAIRADPRNLLQNGDVARGTSAWGLQIVKPSTATMEVIAGGSPAGRPCIQLNSDHASARMAFVLFYQPRLAIERGVRYRLSFQAKADAPLRLGVSVSMNHAPWNGVGLSGLADVGTQWHEVSLNFSGTQDEPDAKLMISPPLGASRVALAGFSLHKADVTGLPPEESLEAGNVSMPLTPEDDLARTPPVAVDFVDFLYQLDGRYFDAMHSFLKNELGCKHPVKGTQVDAYSSYFSQARCDYIDSHGYWQHPSFPHKPWDQADWTVDNSPMVDHGAEVVVELAARRVRGMPFNVSEYCHPAPSTYCAEQVPTIALLGAMQDWDGVVFHCWQESTYDWRHHKVERLPADRIDSWFNMAQHPVKLVTLPFGALAFRRGDVAPAQQETTIGVTLEEEKQWLSGLSTETWRSFGATAGKGVSWREAFTHRLNLDLGSGKVPALLAPERQRAESDTGEVAYDLGDPAGGVITVNAPAPRR